jgi:uncharacterized protein (TIGR00369 family)
MKKLNPEYVVRVRRLVNNSPYFSLLSMRVQDVGIGYAILQIDLENKHLQPFGFIHGGVFASIIDAATFWAVYCGVEDQQAGLTSVDLKLNYLGPVASGRLIARGRQIKLGRSLGYAEAEVTDEKEVIVAHGTSTLMVLPGKKFSIDPALPPKFVEERD